MMFRLVWPVALLMACGHAHVSTKFTSQPKLSEQDTMPAYTDIQVFDWTIIGAHGQVYDTSHSLDADTRHLLSKAFGVGSLTNLHHTLKQFTMSLLHERTTEQLVLGHQGQVKHYAHSESNRHIQVIRSLTHANGVDGMSCFEMHKLYAEMNGISIGQMRYADSSQQQLGLATQGSSSQWLHQTRTKAFAHVDIPNQRLRLYVYVANDGSRTSELSEVVLSCRLSSLQLVRNVE